MLFDLQTLARALGGEISGHEVRAPGPGHSTQDRSLSVKLNGDDFIVHSFAGDDPIICRDFVRQRCNLPPFKPNGHRRRADDGTVERALYGRGAIFWQQYDQQDYRDL